jgi:(4S)-4-hydroxy-5-phosphonooxypentane-2,3-dione isomerase
MYIVHVHVQVKSEYIEEFIAAALDNASNSIQEPGVARFDVIQSLDEPGAFVLVEVYRTPDDVSRHKETAHYMRWRDTVEVMMAKPRQGIKYANLFPGEEGW